MNRLLQAAAALVCAVGLTASAQMTTITATSIKMGGSTIAAGTVTFTPVNAVGAPIPFVGDGSLNSSQAFQCSIENGAITGSCEIPDAQTTTPANIAYSIQITDSGSRRAIVLSTVPNVTGSTWALDAYAPPAKTTNVEPIQVSYGTAGPPSVCVAPSFYIRNFGGGQLYMCVAGTQVLVTGGSGGTVSAATMQAAVAGLTGCSVAGNAWNPATNTCLAASGGTGTQGPKGDKGDQGIQGPKGDTGATGATGEQGIPGVKGDQGDQGLQGATGEKGTPGVQGETGPQGNTGATGSAGAAATIAVGTVSTGPANVTNAGTTSAAVLNFTVPQGIQGVKGDTGAQGASGGSTNWRGTWSSNTAYADFNAVAFSGSSYIAVTASTNITPGTDATKWQLLAQAGATGQQGTPGVKGDTGEQGIPGDKGDQGNQGIQGLKGDTGDTGAAGTQGVKGDTGEQGTQGEQGIPGTKGDTGSAGTAATIEVGSVTTGAAGSAASVTNTGTSSAAVLNFTIPKGDTGDSGSGSGSMVYPGAGIAVSNGSAWVTSLTTPAGALVGTTDTQTLTNKTVNGVTPATFGFLDATSSIQTQVNAKAPVASPTFTGTVTAPTFNATGPGAGNFTLTGGVTPAPITNAVTLTAPSAVSTPYTLVLPSGPPDVAGEVITCPVATSSVVTCNWSLPAGGTGNPYVISSTTGTTVTDGTHTLLNVANSGNDYTNFTVGGTGGGFSYDTTNTDRALYVFTPALDGSAVEGTNYGVINGTLWGAGISMSANGSFFAIYPGHAPTGSCTSTVVVLSLADGHLSYCQAGGSYAQKF